MRAWIPGRLAPAPRGSSAPLPGPARRRFPGWEPLVFQLLAYSLVAATHVVVALSVVNIVVYARGLTTAPGLLIAEAAAGLALIVNALFATSFLTFRSGVLFEGRVLGRFLLVHGAGLIAGEGAFAAVALPLLRAGAAPNAAATAGGALALAATLTVDFVGLRTWVYRRASSGVADDDEAPVLAGPAWRPRRRVDVELASIAAGERQAAWFRAQWLSVTAFVGLSAGLIALGWYCSAILGMNNGDGTARVTQAFAAVFSRDPHLGTLSLIWPPIPALVDIPLVVILRPFGQAFAAGAIMGALFTAGAVILMFRVVRELGAGRWLAIGLAAAFLSFQHIYESSAAGLSEAPFALFLLASLLAYLRWTRTESVGALSFAGLAGAGATMCRYEALFWVAAMGLGIAIQVNRGIPFVSYFRPEHDRPRVKAAIPAALISFAAPFAFVMAVWMIVNIQIKGDPLYFLTGPGSTKTAPDTAAVFGPDHPLWYAYGSLSGTLSLTLDRVSALSPLLLLGTAGLGLYALRRRRLEVIALGMVAWSIPAFDIITAYQGALPPWVRYWYWVVPMGFVLATYAVVRMPAGAAQALASVAVLVFAFAPNVRIFVQTYQAEGFGVGHPAFTARDNLMNALLTTPDLSYVIFRRDAVTEYRRVAAAVDAATPPDALVMLDVVGPGGPIPMFSDHPRRFVTTTDRKFESDVLLEPWKTVQYVLVPYPTFDTFNRSVVLQRFTGIWEGLPWLKLVVDIPGPTRWRLYAVTGAPATPPASAARR